jgi:polyphenol oxidase
VNRPPGIDGAAFTDASDGDQRNDLTARSAVSSWLGISRDWATVRQVHGASLTRAASSGELDDADAIWSDMPGLPVAVFTADCFGVVLSSESAVGVAHAGWRGAASGVVLVLREEMIRQGHEPVAAAIGPGIGPCCFEVGPEVAERFPQDVAETRWGAISVDLISALRRQLDGMDVWVSGACTMHEMSLYSHRRNRTALRNATIAWVS